MNQQRCQLRGRTGSEAQVQIGNDTNRSLGDQPGLSFFAGFVEDHRNPEEQAKAPENAEREVSHWRRTSL